MTELSQCLGKTEHLDIYEAAFGGGASPELVIGAAFVSSDGKITVNGHVREVTVKEKCVCVKMNDSGFTFAFRDGVWSRCLGTVTAKADFFLSSTDLARRFALQQ